jgi:hypothetical protein
MRLEKLENARELMDSLSGVLNNEHLDYLISLLITNQVDCFKCSLQGMLNLELANALVALENANPVDQVIIDQLTISKLGRSILLFKQFCNPEYEKTLN